MNDITVKKLRDGEELVCPYCRGPYNRPEKSLSGPVDLWKCGTIIDAKDKWYRSMDCREQQIAFLLTSLRHIRDSEDLTYCYEEACRAIGDESNG